jgi:hypothetical protein
LGEETDRPDTEGAEGHAQTKDVTAFSSHARMAQPIGESSDADSASDHQLLAAIDAEDGLLAAGNGVLALGAGLDC